MRRMNFPPVWCAYSQLNRAVRAPPMCKKPVGLGANRTRTLMALISDAKMLGEDRAGGWRKAREGETKEDPITMRKTLTGNQETNPADTVRYRVVSRVWRAKANAIEVQH